MHMMILRAPTNYVKCESQWKYLSTSIIKYLTNPLREYNLKRAKIRIGEILLPLLVDIFLVTLGGLQSQSTRASNE